MRPMLRAHVYTSTLIENLGPIGEHDMKAAAVLQLIEKLKAQGLPVDQPGIETRVEKAAFGPYPTRAVAEVPFTVPF